MSEPLFTVAVCTHANPAQLADLFASLAALERPDGGDWELVVVDNCGSQATAQTIAAWQPRLPMRAVREPRQGLPHARNAAVAAARGRWIVWTDDDVLVPPDWLAVYARAMAQHPEAAVFGGRIVPQLGPAPPGWFAAGMDRWPLCSVVANRDLGPDEVPLAPRADAVPWGANYAVRMAEHQHLRYDPALVTGQETDLVARLLAAGAQGWWVPHSHVAHMIRPERLTRAYVARYFHRAGWEVAYLKQRDSQGAPGLAGADGWLGTPGWLLALMAACGGALAPLLFRAGLVQPRLVQPGLRHLARAHYMRGILRFRRGGSAPV